MLLEHEWPWEKEVEKLGLGLQRSSQRQDQGLFFGIKMKRGTLMAARGAAAAAP